MNLPAHREAARAIVLDRHQRVLLVRYDETGGFWATPGGRLEPGEGYAAAACRELKEEIGATGVSLGPQVAERQCEHMVADQQVVQIEQYFLARMEVIAPAAASAPDTIRDAKWWTLGELRATRQTVYPSGLTELLDSVISHGPPARPVTLR